jgi:hypothetical protein
MTARPRTARPAAVVRARALLAGLAVGLATATLVLPASAADEPAITWGVSPSTPEGPDGRSAFDYQVPPGTTITDWVAVTNQSETPATFRVHAADATTDYDTGTFTLVGADAASTDLGAWTAVDSGAAVCPDTDDEAEAACAATLGVSVTVEPGARVDLPFTITVPADATPGDHAAGVVAALEREVTDAEGASVAVSQRVGTRIYLRVDGALTASMAVSGTVAGYDGTPNPIGEGTGRVDFDVTNTGNTRISTQPEVRLTGPFGIDLGSVTLDPVTDLVPGGVAHVSVELPGVPPLLLLDAEVTLHPVAGVGAAASGPVLEPVTASARAWAVPWTALGLLVVLVAGTWGLLRWRRRSRRMFAEDLAEYVDQVRAEALGRPVGTHPSFDESETAR